MIWFDIKQLESKISNNELTDRDGFNYVLAYFILSIIVYSLITNDSNGWVKFLECIISVLINIWGLKAIYEANEKIDGKDFFKRFFSIFWVIGFRLFVITMVITVILGVVIGILSVKSGISLKDPNPIKDIILLVFMSMFLLINYLLIINSFRRLRITTK
jgi:hypothetical protein